MYKMRIYTKCLPRPENERAVFEDVCIDIELPFIPQIGSSMSVTTHHEYSKVVDVIHTSYDTDEYERIGVHLEVPGTINEFAELAAEGWVSA